MISAFAHQLTELEKKTDEQGNQIYQIRTRLQEDTASDSGSAQQAGYDCKHLLNCLQSQIKQNSFKLNELHSKVIQHDVDLSTLKASVVGGGVGALDGHHTAYNPLATEFQPRLAAPFDLAADFSSPGPVSADHRRPASAPYFSVSDYVSGGGGGGGGGEQRDPPGTALGLLPPPDLFSGAATDKEAGGMREVPPPPPPPPPPRDMQHMNRDTELVITKEELAYCRARLRELDMELESKNRVIRYRVMITSTDS